MERRSIHTFSFVPAMGGPEGGLATAALPKTKENTMKLRALFPVVLCFLAGASSSLRAEDQSFDSKGVKIHYIVEGRGEPVVLIHGFTADIDKNWRTGFADGPENGRHGPMIIQALSKNNLVMALD